jgi:hypothetical protein
MFALGRAGDRLPIRRCSSTCVRRCELASGSARTAGNRENCSPFSRWSTRPRTSLKRWPHSAHSHERRFCGRSDLRSGVSAGARVFSRRDPGWRDSVGAARVLCSADTSDDAGDRDRDAGDVVPSIIAICRSRLPWLGNPASNGARNQDRGACRIFLAKRRF